MGYLGLLLFDVLICLLVLFGLIRNSRSTLIGYGAPLHGDQWRPSRTPSLNPCFCLFPSVCLLGVLTLIISWGSLGLELAVAAVSVAMATLPFPLQ